MNVVEQALWMYDNATPDGNLNFSFVSTYRGPVTLMVLKKALTHLSLTHAYLRTTIKIRDLKPFFSPLMEIEIPVRELLWGGTEQWKTVVKHDLRLKFNREDAPLWRVTMLSGEGAGQIIITFHHAIADAVCAAEAINHLYRYISSILLGRASPIIIDFSTPCLDRLYPLIAESPAAIAVRESDLKESTAIASKESDLKQLKGDAGEPAAPHLEAAPPLHTAHLLHVVKEPLTKKILIWAKHARVKVHGLLNAALVQSIMKYKPSASPEIEVGTVVNLRRFFEPTVSKEILRPMISFVSTTVSDVAKKALLPLAIELDVDLHRQLKQGVHIKLIKDREPLFAAGVTPKEFLDRNKMSSNMIEVTNIGVTSFDGSYECDALKMTGLFFVEDFDIFSVSKDNLVLSVTTFNNQIYLSLFYIEEYSCPIQCQRILEGMEKILSDLVG